MEGRDGDGIKIVAVFLFILDKCIFLPVTKYYPQTSKIYHR